LAGHIDSEDSAAATDAVGQLHEYVAMIAWPGSVRMTWAAGYDGGLPAFNNKARQAPENQ
jgi:hypothetical protein